MTSTPQTPAPLGIVGAGLMGRGIAQIALQGGIPVILHDSRPGGADEARAAIAATLQKLVAKGKVSDADAATVLRILDGLFDFYRDPRYRSSPWLKRRALLGVPLLTPEN